MNSFAGAKRDWARLDVLWGAGIHACSGAPLARLEMRVFLEELLSRSAEIALMSEKTPTLVVYPASGFAALPLRIREVSGVPSATGAHVGHGAGEFN